jgi:hypothetical protein
MTRHEETFAAVGAVKGMRLRGTSNEWLATAWVGAGSGYLRSEYIICLWAFYQDHKSTLCKCKLPGGGVRFFPGVPRCICFFCNYRDRKKHIKSSGTGCVCDVLENYHKIIGFVLANNT